jgi:very-short-patch-repair endonuclease
MFTEETLNAETLPLHFGVLARQQERRRQGALPTLTTLVGPTGLGRRLWQEWAARHHRPWVMTTGRSRPEWLEHWVSAILAERDLFVDAERYLAARYTQLERADPPHRLLHKTLFEIETILEHVHLCDYGLEPDRLCAWVLRKRARSEPLSVDRLIGQQLRWCKSSSFSVDHAFRQISRFLGSEATPNLLVLGHDTVSQPDDQTALTRRACELQEVADELAKLVSCAPDLTLGLSIDEAAWHAYLQQAPECFAKAVVHENVISLNDLLVEPIPSPAAGESGRRSCISCDTAAIDVAVSFGDDFQEFPSPITTVHPRDQMLKCEPPTEVVTNEQWKSEYERFLFQLLEDCDDLRGLFELNVDAGFSFGHQPIEVDLACLSLKIAIEIDGYFHFLNPESYRRDRRKDVVLQRNGYIVLRFLTADVVADIPTILDAIRAEVQCRQAQINVPFKT